MVKSVPSSPLILSNISKHFSGVAALTDVSLEVHAGEVHALLGENGAGKSTLMNVASGTLQPDSGIIEISDQQITNLTPHQAIDLGLAIVHQHPAVLPDLTIAENILISVPERLLQSEGDTEKTMRKILDEFGFTASLRDRAETLTVAQQHLLDLAKAFAVNPRILILDEPTAPLGQESVEILFERIRKIVSTGTAVVYITHRLAEVRALADRVTILRDGKWRGTSNVSQVSDNEIMTMIVGRQLESTFPPKHAALSDDGEFIKIENLSSPDFQEISMAAKRGEIVGISGVVGNGQSQLMRSLAGLDAHGGKIIVNNKEVGNKELLLKTAYLPADRHGEGLMMPLSVRENTSVSALSKFSQGLFISRKREDNAVLKSLKELDVKAPSMDSEVSALSGGNQQKVIMSRSLLSDPIMIVADEPTQGVDVGARAEIYKILRNVANSGIPVIVNSSDTKELEGLCDRVYVMSRGHIVESLEADKVTEENMVAAAIRSTTLKRQEIDNAVAASQKRTFRKILQSDFVPPIVLTGMISLLALFIFSKNDLYFGSYNINAVLGLGTGLGFIALGQTIVLMTGGIDLSVGPASGVLLVVASFFVNDGQSFWLIALGFALIPIVALVIGLANGFLIRFANFTPVAGTLTVYIALIGIGFLLRPAPGGYINTAVTDFLLRSWGPIPSAFIVLMVAAITLEVALRKTKWGIQLRASGSNEESARRLGVNINRSIMGAYVASALFAGVGAVIFMGLIGVGDPAQGPTYTLQSITAVVLGGTSLLGGRGSFIGALLGSVLMVQVLNACVFLDLSQTWQYLFQGLLIVLAALSYTLTRTSRR
ncbi:MAG: ATP-binding cassette domain-containing protein [Candidatus Nanopelagicaceae bacterium]|nr:ATP-binding cassette domain-containing protein [Candidatus Nanopelagicaceae bacterium]